MSLLPTSAAPLAIAPTAAKPRRLDFEVVIAGAGMVGSTLAAALGQAGIRVGLIEGRDLSQGVGADGRASALALGTARILQRIGVWPLMEAWGVSPIHRIQVCKLPDSDR
ncbi:FAD-dependent monooxygenase [Thermostichus sp. MS-CIW-26]|jgi:2-polyprenyl-6-methoxyphenol hydroxylase-like FAD-dependent oxidoreductase